MAGRGRAFLRRTADKTRGVIKQDSLRAIASDNGVQVGMEVAEGAMGFLSAALDTVAANTESAWDDKAMPYIKKGIATGARLFAGKVMSRKHPGLALITMSAASALSGTVYYDGFQRVGVKAVTKAAERLQRGSSE